MTTHPSPRRRPWLWLPTLTGVLALALASGLGRAPESVAAGAVHAAPTGAVAQGEDNFPVYLPFIRTITTTPVNLRNGSFEAGGWYTDYSHNGSQWPVGWTFYATENGVVMPIPTKHQEGHIIPAIAGGYGEYVHRPAKTLPKGEYPGTPRALIIDGWTTYKAFSAAIPQALRLSQVLTGTPGALMRVTGYILGETYDTPGNGNAALEDDHWVASVQLGAAADTRPYVVMITHLDVPGNVRHWNKFVVEAVIPPNGQLLLQVIAQQNWAGRTDFFIDAFSAVQIQ